MLLSLLWRATDERDQVRFLLSIQFTRPWATRSPPGECRFQSLFHKALSDTLDGRRAHFQCLTDSCIPPGWPHLATISFEQDAGVHQFSCRGLALADQLLQVCSFFLR